MANVKFSELTELTTLADADLFAVTDDSEASVEQTKYIQASTLRDYILILGQYHRSKFEYKDADEIYLNPGFYDVDGKYAFWTSQLTEQIVSPSASTWYYVYLDYSAITSGTAITATEIITSTTAPSWSASKLGYYNGSDRCIFAVLTDGSSNIREFYHSGDYVLYADQITDRTFADLDTTWTDVTLSIPGFSRKANVTFRTDSNGGGTASLYWRVNGQTGTTGHYVGQSKASQNENVYNTLQVITDSSNIIEVKHDDSGTNACAVTTNGWYFPEFM